MGCLLRSLKSLFFWRYGRNTWQYDVLCVLILAFIFLTPKRWFETSELRQNQAHQNQFASMVLVGAENFPAQPDRAELERRVRTLVGRADLQVAGFHERRDERGKIVAYEVDLK